MHPRYYGYRLGLQASGDQHQYYEDVRLSLLQRCWFEGRDVLDVGCNEGIVTLEVCTTCFAGRRLAGGAGGLRGAMCWMSAATRASSRSRCAADAVLQGALLAVGLILQGASLLGACWFKRYGTLRDNDDCNKSFTRVFSLAVMHSARCLWICCTLFVCTPPLCCTLPMCS